MSRYQVPKVLRRLSLSEVEVVRWGPWRLCERMATVDPLL